MRWLRDGVEHCWEGYHAGGKCASENSLGVGGML